VRAGLDILVVDDNEINLMLIEDVLLDLGANVSTAVSGAEAIAIAQTKQFDLVFMDVQMPEMNGLEATAQLRKMNFKYPIIAFSANAYKEDMDKSIEAGMNDYLCKPFTQEELQTILRRWTS
jgi:CheY-like chemotaxis protein